MKNFRHGDLNISKTDKLVGYKARKDNVLAWGEATGHAHRIKPKTKEDVVEIYENEKGELAIKVKGVAVVTHEEHHTIEIPTGTYQIIREREYDYFQMNSRKVID